MATGEAVTRQDSQTFVEKGKTLGVQGVREKKQSHWNGTLQAREKTPRGQGEISKKTRGEKIE